MRNGLTTNMKKNKSIKRLCNRGNSCIRIDLPFWHCDVKLKKKTLSVAGYAVGFSWVNGAETIFSTRSHHLMKNSMELLQTISPLLLYYFFYIFLIVINANTHTHIHKHSHKNYIYIHIFDIYSHMYSTFKNITIIEHSSACLSLFSIPCVRLQFCIYQAKIWYICISFHDDGLSLCDLFCVYEWVKFFLRFTECSLT